MSKPEKKIKLDELDIHNKCLRLEDRHRTHYSNIMEDIDPDNPNYSSQIIKFFAASVDSVSTIFHNNCSNGSGCFISPTLLMTSYNTVMPFDGLHLMHSVNKKKQTSSKLIEVVCFNEDVGYAIVRVNEHKNVNWFPLCPKHLEKNETVNIIHSGLVGLRALVNIEEMKGRYKLSINGQEHITRSDSNGAPIFDMVGNFIAINERRKGKHHFAVPVFDIYSDIYSQSKKMTDKNLAKELESLLSNK